jgi:hypothetical protein
VPKSRDVVIRMPLLYIGERATCYCCTDLLPVRLIGIDTDVAGRQWTATKALMDALYLDLSLPEVLGQRRASCFLCKRPIVEQKSRHFWLNRDSSDVEGRFIIGPSCSKCLQNQVLLLEEKSGRSIPPVAYMIEFTPALAKRLQADVALSAKAAKSADSEAWKVATSDDFPIF